MISVTDWMYSNIKTTYFIKIKADTMIRSSEHPDIHLVFLISLSFIFIYLAMMCNLLLDKFKNCSTEACIFVFQFDNQMFFDIKESTANNKCFRDNAFGSSICMSALIDWWCVQGEPCLHNVSALTGSRPLCTSQNQRHIDHHYIERMCKLVAVWFTQ